jgi:hypothetical protein
MILILCDANDAAARAFRPVLGAAASAIPVEILTTAEFLYSTSLTHWIGGGRAAHAQVLTRRLGLLGSDNLTGVINRIEVLPQDHLATVSPGDRSYVQQETQAVIASWLTALSCPVFNRPSAIALAGQMLGQVVWENHATACGLPVVERPFGIDGDDPPPLVPARSVIVFNGKAIGAGLDPATAAACCRLAHHAGLDLVEIALNHHDGRDVFVNATPLANLVAGGRALASAIARACAGEVR